MSQRSPVSFPQNIWFDSEQVDDSDLKLEQDFNTNSHASLVNNHIGAGVIPESLGQLVLFDSEEYIQNAIRAAASTSSPISRGDVVMDGKKVEVVAQPTDQNFGNQLEVELSGSSAAGKRKVKVAIIGKDFQGNLQFDTFYFSTNERQYTKKHYTNVLMVLLNDFVGPPSYSMNLGGIIRIKEAPPLKISRDPIMVAQNVEPNLFFRDFFTTTTPPSSVQSLLINSLPFFNTDTLGIFTGYKDNKVLAMGDTTTQVGQKFLATTNNIQKIRLLLSVSNSDYFSSSDLRWGGDLIVSVYPLQSSVSSVYDIVPDYAIDFQPSSRPLAQLTYSYDSLKESGFILDETPQPVDFVFSNTVLANGSAIIPGKYYAVIVNRAGADRCDISITSGSNRTPNSRATIFSEEDWHDLPEDNLWFEVYTDAIKVTDGQAYETGHGIIVDKIKRDSATGETEDYSLDSIQFIGNQRYSAIVSAATESGEQIQDQRTGNPVFSRKQFKPEVKLLNSLEINGLRKTSQPLVIGTVSDENQKFTSEQLISAKIKRWTYLKNKIIIKSDSSSADLRNAIVNGGVVGAKIKPNTLSSSISYRISKADIVTMKYGDINNDGIVDAHDLREFERLQTIDVTSSPPLISDISYSIDGYLSYKNSYPTFTQPFKNGSVTFEVVDPRDPDRMVRVASFSDSAGNPSSGNLIIDPNKPFLASIQSPSMASHFGDRDSNNRLLVEGKLLVVRSSSATDNIGVFRVNPSNPVTKITDTPPAQYQLNIEKLYYNEDLVMKIFRADVDEDFIVSSQDKKYIETYVSKKLPSRAFQENPPFDQQYYNNVGKSFDVIVLTLDNDVYNSTDTGAISASTIDRSDDYYSAISARGKNLHAITDICVNDRSSFIGRRFVRDIYSGTNMVTEKDKNTVFVAPLGSVIFTSIIAGGIQIGDTIRIKNGYPYNMDIVRKISGVRSDGYIEMIGTAPIDATGCTYSISRDNPIELSIQKKLRWDESLLRAFGKARHVPSAIDLQFGSAATDPLTKDSFDPGSVDCYIPNNLIVGDVGEIKRPDGNFYKVDFEVGTVTIEIPDGFVTLGPDGYSVKEQSVKVFENFVAEDNFNPGLTSKGFKAMRFADGSVVKADALAKNQIRFSASVQSFSPNTDGEDIDGYRGTIVDGRMGVAMDYATGILTLNFANLKQHATMQTVSTKIQVSVFLKKGGFNNTPLLVDSVQTQNMLNLGSIFTAAGVPRPGINAPTVVTDLAGPTISGTLPVSHGGTGLTTIGPAGTILSSNGTGLVYEKKNPFSLIAFCGVASANSTTPVAIGAFTFATNTISYSGLSSLVLDSILELSDNNSGNRAQLRLYSVNESKYIDLYPGPTSPAVDFVETFSQNASLVSSGDLFSSLNSSASNYVYEIHLSLSSPQSSAGEVAICKMAGLFAKYNGPPLPLPTTSSPPRSDLILNTARITTDSSALNSIQIIGASYSIPDSVSFLSIGLINRDIDVILPPPSDNKIGKQICIKDSQKSSRAYRITINGTIDGNTSAEITPPNYSITLIYDGTQWCSV